MAAGAVFYTAWDDYEEAWGLYAEGSEFDGPVLLAEDRDELEELISSGEAQDLLDALMAEA